LGVEGPGAAAEPCAQPHRCRGGCCTYGGALVQFPALTCPPCRAAHATVTQGSHRRPAGRRGGVVAAGPAAGEGQAHRAGRGPAAAAAVSTEVPCAARQEVAGCARLLALQTQDIGYLAQLQKLP
jgi:hypothetical protein